MWIGIYISIITLNINELNTPTKEHRLAECIQNQDPVCDVYKRTTDIETHRDWEGSMEKYILAI